MNHGEPASITSFSVFWQEVCGFLQVGPAAFGIMTLMIVTPHEFSGTLAEEWAKQKPGLNLYWLGQAGFALRYDGLRLVIDPYLSDSLAEKYAHSDLSHERMMPSPIDPAEFGDLELVLVTHQHGDHMDPETLRSLASLYPSCRFVVPSAEIEYASSIPLSSARLTGADANRPVLLDSKLTLVPVPAAHETLTVDSSGSHHFLGYLLRFPGITIYHSGDSIPYDGLMEILRNQQIDLALLPVNGRDSERLTKGIAGNFTLAEAIGLCRQAQIPALIAHHYGMFAFNTIDAETIDQAANFETNLRIYRAQTNTRYSIGS
jgi:L-ascorbate metabolism protein UlaG (beta-lactamase superfamily)